MSSDSEVVIHRGKVLEWKQNHHIAQTLILEVTATQTVPALSIYYM